MFEQTESTGRCIHIGEASKPTLRAPALLLFGFAVRLTSSFLPVWLICATEA